MDLNSSPTYNSFIPAIYIKRYWYLFGKARVKREGLLNSKLDIHLHQHQHRHQQTKETYLQLSSSLQVLPHTDGGYITLILLQLVPRNPQRLLTNQDSQTLQAQETQQPASPAKGASLTIEIRLDLVHARKLLPLLHCVRRIADVEHALYPSRSCGDGAAMGEDVE